MSDWWEERRRRRRTFWSDIFEEFERMEEIMEEMMRRAFQMPFRETSEPRSYVYGFSVTIGPDGKPVVRQFGNVAPGRFGPEIREEREPLVDVIEEKASIKVVAELPGVEKEDIKLNATEDALTISVDTPQRKYYKEVTLPAKIDPKSAKATYKNGVLEVKLAKKEVSREEKGEPIKIE